MKKVIIVIALLMLACNNKAEKKDDVQKKTTTVEKKEVSVLKSFTVSEPNKWLLKSIAIDTSETTNEGEKIIKLSRTENNIAAYVAMNKVPVFLGSKYRVSFIVKRTEDNKLFGLRMAGVYPNRSDAIFDLEKGTVNGQNSTGDFEKEEAFIELIGADWYKCTLTSEVFADQLNVIFGPTSYKNGVPNWESGTEILSDINILSNSIVLEEISL